MKDDDTVIINDHNSAQRRFKEKDLLLVPPGTVGKVPTQLQNDKLNAIKGYNHPVTTSKSNTKKEPTEPVVPEKRVTRSKNKAVEKAKPVQKPKPKEKKEKGKKEVETFAIEAIIDKRTRRGKREYKVLWENYGEDEATWEPEKNLIADGQKEFITEFNRMR